MYFSALLCVALRKTSVNSSECYSIISDYLGTPIEAYNSTGTKVWERELDIYGNSRKGDSTFVGLHSVPFLYQGQYFDKETGLAYNRFRYYNPETGTYISQDPIGLAGNNPNIYAYVADVNCCVDVFGLVGAGVGGAYMFGFENGKMYIGKGEKGRMGSENHKNTSIYIRQQQLGKDPKTGKYIPIKGRAHISTNGNNDLGKMVEYKAMVDAGFTPGGKSGVPDNYLNNHLSGKSTWDAKPQLQSEATELANKLKNKYDADVEANKFKCPK